MSIVTVETAHNVALEYEPASLGDRVLAALIDVIIIVGLFWGIILFATLASGNSDHGYLLLIFLLPVIFYHFLCETFMDGQSFGKRFRRIRVVRSDGTQPTVGGYFLRWIFRIVEVDMLWGLPAIIAVALNGQGQRIGDMAAGTTVIKLQKPVTLADTLLPGTPDSYQPRFPEAIHLSDDQVTTIRRLLDVENRDYDWETYNALATRTQRILEEKLKITSSMPPTTFLKTLLQDYNHYRQHETMH